MDACAVISDASVVAVSGPALDWQQIITASSESKFGIAADTITMKPAGKHSAGETILAKADELGCDLIVKGAYTQSRLRQMIFGGTTRHILANAKLPLLMAH